MKSILFFLILSMYFSFSLLAQQENGRIASLKNSIAKTEDTEEKVNLTNQLTAELIKLNLPEASIQAEQAYALAQKTQNKKAEAHSLIYLGLAHNNQGNIAQALQAHTKALALMDFITDKQLLCVNFNSLGSIYLNEKKDFKTALQYYTLASIVAQEFDFQSNGNKLADALKGIANSYNGLARYYYNNKNEQKYNHYNKRYQQYQILYQGLVFVNYEVNKFGQKDEEEGRTYTSPNIPTSSENNISESNRKKLLDIDKRRSEIEILSRSNKINEIEGNKIKLQLQHEHDSIMLIEKELLIADYKQNLENKDLQISQLTQNTSNNVFENESEKNSKFWWVTSLFLISAVSLLYVAYHLQKKNQVILAQKEKLNEIKAIENRQKVVLHEKLQTLEKKEEDLFNTKSQLDDVRLESNNITQILLDEIKEPLEFVEKAVLSDDEINNLALQQQINLFANTLQSIDVVQQPDKFNHTLVKENQSIYKIARQATEQVEELARLKGIQIENRIKPFYYAFVDADCIKRVMVNLFANSIKYTPKGGRITLDSLPLLQNGEHFIKISLSDNGQGISNKSLNLVFEKFSPEEARPSAFGLAFVKMAIEAHNGKVEVVSDKEEGVSFIFTLPEVKMNAIVDVSTVLNESEFMELESAREDILLHDNEQKLLAPFLIKFNQIEFYETSQLINLLSQIQTIGNEHIKNWKKAMEDAIHNLKEEKYKELIKLF